MLREEEIWFEEQLGDLGVRWSDTGSLRAAIAAIKERDDRYKERDDRYKVSEARVFRLMEKVRELEGTNRTLSSKLGGITQTMDSYVKAGANDQLFYLTEFMQDHFPLDIGGDYDVVVMVKRLLTELKDRRSSKMCITKEKFVKAFHTACDRINASGAVCSKVGIVQTIKELLGWMDVEDMVKEWASDQGLKEYGDW